MGSRFVNAASQVDVTSQKIKALFEGEIAAGRLQFPILPESAIKVRATATNPNCNARDLARIIEADPALAARILKLANSAMFAGLTEIRDLTHALGRLGNVMVMAVVMAAAGKESFRSANPIHNALLEESWRDSLFAAALGKNLGPKAGVQEGEGFLVGLLHCAGVPILLTVAEALVKTGKMEPLPQQEIRDALRPLMPVAGSKLLAKWGLPELLVAAVQFQDDLFAAPPENQKLAALVALARITGEQLGEGALPAEISARLADTPAVGLLKLDPGILLEMVVQAFADGKELAEQI